MRIALHTYVRYALPLTLIAGIAFAPLFYLAVGVPVPADLEHANGASRTAWVLAGAAWMFQLALVGAAAPAARSVARGAPLSQVGAFRAGVANLVRTAIPVALAAAAIALGLLAFVVPGVVLLGLLALTGASEGRGLPAPLVDSIARVRAQPWPVVAVIAAMLVFDLGAAAVVHKLIVAGPLPKIPTPQQLGAVSQVARVTVFAIAAASPIAAVALASLSTRRT